MLDGSQTRSLTLMTGILLFLAALVEMITAQRLDTLVVAIGELMLNVSDGYTNPSAKAPMIHPGDEAPFLHWGK